MNKTQKLLIGTIFTLIVLVALGLFLVKRYSPTGAAVYDLKEISLAINTVPNSALIFIAQEKGYFAEQRLRINYHNFPTGKLALDALIGGGADIATTADVPIALAGLAGQDISVLATIEFSNDNIQVVARKGINKPTDLKGKKIATTGGGGPLFFTHQFLKKHNIAISDVDLVFLKPSDMALALINKDIDAFIVFEPAPSIAKKEVKDLTIFAPNDLYGETWNIVVMQNFEKENKETITRFLKALLQAENFLKSDREESLEIVSKYSEIDKALLRDIMKKQKYGVVLNKLIIDYPRQEAEWAIEQRMSSQKNIPDFNDFVNKDYLKKLNPEAVTI